jgi:Zn-dependent protease
VTNIIIATIAISALQFPGVIAHQLLSSTILVIAKINVVLGALNLIPIPPLDGSRILLGILPQRAQIALLRIEPYGLIILFGLLFTGLLNPVIMFVQKLIVAFIRIILRI